MTFPVKIPIEVSAGEVTTFDTLGDEVITQGDFHAVKCFAYTVTPVQLSEDGAVMHIVEQLKVMLRPGDDPGPGGRFRTPDGRVWRPDGVAKDPNNNPWWRPGLVTVYAREVTG